MDIPEVRPGDIFCSRNPMWLGRAICAVQSLHDLDNKSKYSHSGLILANSGKTFESLWTVRSGNIYNDYRDGILIARHKKLTPELWKQGFLHVYKRRGQWYPFYRLVFHLVGPTAAKVSFGRVVCSEMTLEPFYHVGLVPFYKGASPGKIENMVNYWEDVERIYEGNLNDIIREG